LSSTNPAKNQADGQRCERNAVRTQQPDRVSQRQHANQARQRVAAVGQPAQRQAGEGIHHPAQQADDQVPGDGRNGRRAVDQRIGVEQFRPGAAGALFCQPAGRQQQVAG
jgi:hypothetical protein